MDDFNAKKTFLGALCKIYREFKYILYLFFVVITCLLLVDFMLNNQEKVSLSIFGYMFSELSVSLVCIITFLLGNITGFFYAFIIKFRLKQSKKVANIKK